jgi:hypothetical protein
MGTDDGGGFLLTTKHTKVGMGVGDGKDDTEVVPPWDQGATVST